MNNKPKPNGTGQGKRPNMPGEHKTRSLEHARSDTRVSERRARPAPPSENTKKTVRYVGPCDRGFLTLVLILICFGSVMVFSASYAYSMSQDPGNGYLYIRRQILYVLIGLGVMLLISRVEPEVIRKAAPLAYLATVALLILVFIIGTVGGGAKRWIVIAGISVQPSEIAKTTLVLMLALHFEKFGNTILEKPNSRYSILCGLIWPLGYVAIVCGLVALEKHLSGTIILFLIGIIVIWAGGANQKAIFIPGIVGGSLLGIIAFAVPYTKRRIDIWLDPTKDLTGDGWQTVQGLRAIGSGGLLGLGPTNSRQKHMYVSQPQNDFIFSILCEELGFVGALAVIILFILLIIKGYKIALKAPDTFSALVVTGIVSKVGIQAAFNMGVVTNLLPNTGISLPFFSYGGSSTVVLLFEMGIVLSISRFSRQDR